MPLSSAAVLLAALALPRPAAACTSLLVTRGASTDGSTFITYAADSHELYGFLKVLPAADHPPGALRDIFDTDSGDRVGQIEEAPHTWHVVGLMNEHQVAIGETTFGGREELVDPKGGIDYGSLMEVALQRARTAREAIDVMTSVVARVGYRSEGESFSIADPEEAWILEMIGKGPGRKGAVWVARRLPDGTISGHANQARIGTFPLDDKKSTLWAPDVITFAREKGWFKGQDAEFSFADTYHPLTFGGLRFCEARVWSLFRRAAPSLGLGEDFVRPPVAAGTGGVPPQATVKRLPLWIKPDKKLGLQDVFSLMRDHFEGTSLDLSKGTGAGPYGLPYRWRPLTWEADGQKYLNERAISTQQTGFSFVSQSRSHLPDAIGGVLWFGVDDTYSTVWMPLYTGLQEAPFSLAPERGDLERFSWDSLFWVTNAVSNLVYGRYSEMIVDVQKVQGELEGRFLASQAEVEARAMALHATSPGDARDFLARYSTDQVARVHARWRTLFDELMVKYMDGNLKDEHGRVEHPGYPQAWREAVVKGGAEHLRVTRLPGEPDGTRPIPVQGYFHGAGEMGPMAAGVPKDFPWNTHKLLLVSGSNACGRPPACCVVPREETSRLLVTPPDGPADPCGDPGWLIQVPREETRPILRASEED